MSDLQELRARIRQRYLQTEPEIVTELLTDNTLNERERSMLETNAADVVTQLRENEQPTLMESFLSEYGLSTPEGVGLMCLAEALLRVPDPDTIDELIADKIEPSNWGVHLGQSSSSLVNASTWALMLTGRILDDDDGKIDTNPVSALRQLIKRMGEPVVRTAVSQAMKMLGKQFVLGENMQEALSEALTWEQKGYTYSYDMLGEAARTEDDAQRYFEAYSDAIDAMNNATGSLITDRPGISIKLSALHPRYEYTQKAVVMAELVPRIAKLVQQAADANIGLNIDAEEADRLDLSLDIIDALTELPALDDWQGFGVVIQAYSRRALPVIDWLVALCNQRKRHIMVRLVKGAYWDGEIKQAQELGLANFPVFTRKSITDLSYLVCAQRLLSHRDCIYPQFATHNAHTVCAIEYLAGKDKHSYEFQRLHGMGESLHQHILQKHQTRCRIYAPVGAHVDLLAYLVRRLLENGANSSFVNQIVDTEISPSTVAACPITQVIGMQTIEHPAITKPLALFKPERQNSKGYRINDPASIQVLLDTRESFLQKHWSANCLIPGDLNKEHHDKRFNPARPETCIGEVYEASDTQIELALSNAAINGSSWSQSSYKSRINALNTAADLYEEHIAEFCALACLEAGKHIGDGIAEVREAVDFLRYYATQLNQQHSGKKARGIIVCISPWNFPLAIFTGQIAAALAAGNSVIAKPAQQTPLIAAKAVAILHQAGIPDTALQFLPGDGARVGNTLISDPRISGVCFTGSTAVARHIQMQLCGKEAERRALHSPANPLFIAETGGLNAMIADSTALPEQVVRDVLISAFQSAGQRCSALRMLYVQEDTEERLLEMLCGALDALNFGDPWSLSTDIGPVIDVEAQAKIENYIERRQQNGQVIKRVSGPDTGSYCSAAIIRVNGIEELEEEIFGPVLHVATFKANDIEKTINAINNTGYGLTFGLHTRIDDRVQSIVEKIQAGNVYVNRNQIGAVVGSQPFGGEGLSGTGPKAGGPLYLPRFFKPEYDLEASPDSSKVEQIAIASVSRLSLTQLQSALESLPRMQQELVQGATAVGPALQNLMTACKNQSTTPISEQFMPGPTGESNQWTLHPRGRVLILAWDDNRGLQMTCDALLAGCSVVLVSPEPMQFNLPELKDNLPFVELTGDVAISDLSTLSDLDAVGVCGNREQIAACAQALASRAGHILPLVNSLSDPTLFSLEKHICIDTTAAGGNASLLAATDI